MNIVQSAKPARLLTLVSMTVRVLGFKQHFNFFPHKNL